MPSSVPFGYHVLVIIAGLVLLIIGLAAVWAKHITFIPGIRTRISGILLACFGGLFLLAGLFYPPSPQSTSPAGTQVNQDTVFQLSTIDALSKGLYEGSMPVSAALAHGNFGLGTFQGLDGEMVLVDGKMYQVPVTGQARLAGPDQVIPFMALTFFEADQEQPLQAGTTMQALMQDIEAKLPTRNIFYAIRIEGTFQKIQTRSVPRQNPPYPPLAEVVKKQAVFDLANIEGVAVGFWCPAYVEGMNVPGYHLHFISKDGTAGGHVLDFTIADGVAKIDWTHDFVMILPDSPDFYQMDFSAQ
jgi:acetolactate decarboxylase